MTVPGSVFQPDEDGRLNALTMAHRFLASHIREGAFCIDATAGRGHDTAFLCGLAGAAGRVLAFDVQEDAVKSTSALLEEKGLADRARVILDSHENMAAYAQPGTVDAVVFNFGWLPGGDHKVFTRPESSVAAIKTALSLLKPHGVVSLCVYYGRDTGYAERDALLQFLPSIDPKVATVLACSFANRPNDPPFPVFILKSV